jgi:hypothetical protein
MSRLGPLEARARMYLQFQCRAQSASLLERQLLWEDHSNLVAKFGGNNRKPTEGSLLAGL